MKAITTSEIVRELHGCIGDVSIIGLVKGKEFLIKANSWNAIGGDAEAEQGYVTADHLEINDMRRGGARPATEREQRIIDSIQKWAE